MEEVNIDLYLMSMEDSKTFFSNAMRFKQFVPWNVGFAVKHFIANATKMEECQDNPVTKVDNQTPVSNVSTFTPTSFKPNIHLIYNTCIDNKVESISPLAPYKNDAVNLNSHLKKSIALYMKSQNIVSENLKWDKNLLPELPIHHILNLMCQIHYDRRH